MLVDWVGNKIYIEKWNSQAEKLYRRNSRKAQFIVALVLRNLKQYNIENEVPECKKPFILEKAGKIGSYIS